MLPERGRTVVNRIQEWAGRRSRLLVWLGLLIAVIAPIIQTPQDATVRSEAVRYELQNKEDIHNLYYAAAGASWRDTPGWWIGSWIYPDVGYYRPLTSMLFLFEYQAFGSNFTAYNRISRLLHHLNVGLLYLLTVSLFRAHRRSRALLGLVAVNYFTSTDNSMYFAVMRILSWWPAQNDILSLTFGLLCLLLLDQYLHRPNRVLLAGSLVSLFLGIAAKEMGFIVGPVALALIAQRRMQGIGPWRAPVISITLFTGFMWFFRRMVIPHHWGPVMFRMLILKKLLQTWLGPPADMIRAGIYWPAAAGVSIGAIVSIGLHRHWPVLWIAGLSALAAGLCAQFIGEDTSLAILAFYPDEARLWSVLTYLLAGALFLRYARTEPGLFTAFALWLVYLPILQYGGGQ